MDEGARVRPVVSSHGSIETPRSKAVTTQAAELSEGPFNISGSKGCLKFE